MRELRMERTCVGWNIRAQRDMRKEEEEYRENNFVKICWKQKEDNSWNDRCMKERTRY